MKIAKSITGLAACATLGWNLDAAYSLTLYAGAPPAMNERLDQFDAQYDANIGKLEDCSPSDRLEVLGKISATDDIIFRNSLKADCKGMIEKIGIDVIGWDFQDAVKAIVKDGKDNSDPRLVMVPHGQKADDDFQVLYLYQKKTWIPSAYFMTDAMGRALVASTGHMATMKGQFVRISAWRPRKGADVHAESSSWESGYEFSDADIEEKYDVIQLSPEIKDFQLGKFDALVATINRTAGEKQKYFLASHREAKGIIKDDKLNPIECLKDATITEFDLKAPTTTYVGTHKGEICYIMPAEKITERMLFGIKYYALLHLTSHFKLGHLWAVPHLRCFTPGATGLPNVKSISVGEFRRRHQGVPWNFYELQQYSQEIVGQRINSRKLVEDLAIGEKDSVLASYGCVV